MSPLAVHYTNTITLGTAIVGAIVALAALVRLAYGVRLRATNDIQAREIQALEADVRNKDRRLNELGAEKDAALSATAACQATIKELRTQIDAMPNYQDVITFGSEQMKQVNDAAAKRQESFVQIVVAELRSHDEHVERIHQESEDRASQRHEQQTGINTSILKALSRVMQNTNNNKEPKR